MRASKNVVTLSKGKDPLFDRLHRASVLPRVAVERKAGGTLVHAVRPSTAEVRELVLFGIAFLLFLGAALAPRGGVTAQVIRGINAAGVLMGFLGMLAELLRRRRVFKATLRMGNWPIRLGDTVEVSFRAMLRKSAPVSSVAAKLQCREEVTIGRGRGEHKKSATAYELDLPCSNEERSIVEEEWTLTIPSFLPPSLFVPANMVEWRVNATLTANGVDIPAHFVLLVIPEVVE